MRKIILSILVISLLGIFSCGKDETAPKVMLEGESTMDHVLNSEYVEPGFAAFDDEDGNITDKVVVSILDVDKASEQIITYTVTDTEGNEGENSRKITVFNQANILDGFWSGEYIFPYPNGSKVEYYEEVTASKTVNTEIEFHHLGGNSDSYVLGKFKSNKLIFENQTVNGKALVVTNTIIKNNNTHITIEYTLDGVTGILVLAKNN